MQGAGTGADGCWQCPAVSGLAGVAPVTHPCPLSPSQTPWVPPVHAAGIARALHAPGPPAQAGAEVGTWGPSPGPGDPGQASRALPWVGGRGWRCPGTEELQRPSWACPRSEGFCSPLCCSVPEATRDELCLVSASDQACWGLVSPVKGLPKSKPWSWDSSCLLVSPANGTRTCHSRGQLLELWGKGRPCRAGWAGLNWLGRNISKSNKGFEVQGPSSVEEQTQAPAGAAGGGEHPLHPSLAWQVEARGARAPGTEHPVPCPAGTRQPTATPAGPRCTPGANTPASAPCSAWSRSFRTPTW